MSREEEGGTLFYGEREIDYQLLRSERKRLTITVSPDLSVKVKAPVGVSDERIQKALREKKGWIAQALEKVEAHHPLPGQKEYVSGESFFYLGRQYRLKVEEGESGPARLMGPFLYVKEGKGEGEVKKSVDRWFRVRAEEVFRRYLGKCMEVTNRHGVPHPSLTIRPMTRRWGSCGLSGRITLNLYLARAPVHCIEYVITHELCHLKYPNHSRAFFSLLTRCLPDWKKRKRLLESICMEI